MKKPAICDHCGARNMEHQHNLTKILVKALERFAASPGFVVLGEMNLSFSMRTNAYKLRYWGLIETSDADTRAWSITPLGKQFLNGEVRLHKKVWTFRNKPIRFEGTEVLVTEVDKRTTTREEYAATARPHNFNSTVTKET